MLVSRPVTTRNWSSSMESESRRQSTRALRGAIPATVSAAPNGAKSSTLRRKSSVA